MKSATTILSITSMILALVTLKQHIQLKTHEFLIKELRDTVDDISLTLYAMSIQNNEDEEHEEREQKIY